MSFDLGKDAPFNPPPPPKKRLSPWAMVGIGCSVLLVGSVVGIGGCIAVMTKSIQDDMKKPINKQQILQDLADTPLYPKIQFDEQVTKAGGAAMKMFSFAIPAKKTVVAGFRTENSAPEVYAWYDEKMAAVGFTKERGQDSKQQIYRRGVEMVLVQVRKDRGDWTGLILMRFYGVKKR